MPAMPSPMIHRYRTVTPGVARGRLPLLLATLALLLLTGVSPAFGCSAAERHHCY